MSDKKVFCAGFRVAAETILRDVLARSGHFSASKWDDLDVAIAEREYAIWKLLQEGNE